MTGKVAALGAVKDSLNRAQSTIDVAMSAGQQVADLLIALTGDDGLAHFAAQIGSDIDRRICDRFVLTFDAA